MLHFERPAKENIKLSWDHGRYLDLWTVLYVATGVSAGIGALLLGLPLWQALSVIAFLAFLYKVWEILVDIIEDVENALTDVMAVLLGAGISFFLFSDFNQKILFFILLLSIGGDLVLLLLGWQASLRKRLQNKAPGHLQSPEVSEDKKLNFRDNVIFFGGALAIIPAPILFYIDPKIFIIWLSLVFLISAYILYKEKIGQELLVALLFALWITSYHTYTYVAFNITIGKVNLFPLIGWTAGLVLLREFYERHQTRYKLFFWSAIYIVLLFSLEYIGYYTLDIKLESNYPSLFGLGIIHGPFIIYLFYLLAGPIYLIVTDYLKVK